jgi:hypothetical protein
MPTGSNESDRELLIRIDEKLKALQAGFEAERSAAAVRQAKYDSDLEKLRLEVDSLRTSRAQFVGAATTLSFLVSILVKVFWH